MNQRNDFDRAFKDKLEHYASPTPTHLFDAIEAKRANPPAKGWRFAYWPWLGALLFVLLVGGGIWAYQSFDFRSGLAERNAAEPIGQKESSTLAEQQTNNSNLNTLSTLTTTSGSQSEKVSTETETTATEETVSAENTNTQYLVSNTKKAKSNSKQSTFNTQAELINSSSHSSEFAAKGVSISPEKIENPVTESTEMDIDRQVEEVKDDRPALDFSAFKPIAFGGELPNSLESLNAKMPTGSKCADFKAKGVSFYLDLYGSPNIPIRTLTAKSEDFIDYAQQRRDSEAVNYALSAGARMAAVFASGASLRAGVEYTQINELFSYNNPDATRINVEYIVDSLGNVLWADTSYVSGTHIVMTHNRYRILDIPVAIGYELELANFVLSIHGGAHFNLLFRQKGDFLSPDGNEPVDFSSSNANAYDAFRNNIGVSLAGSFGLNYKLNSHTLLLFEPHFRYFLKPFTNDNYVVSQRYFNTGMTLGLRLKL